MSSPPPSSSETLLKQRLWAGRIPVVFCLDPNEVTTLHAPRPFYAMVPRMSYLVSQTRDVVEYFREAAPPTSAMQPSSIWFEAKGVPLHWHLPFGLLRDVLCGLGTDQEINLPWALTVHFLGFPADVLLPCDNEQSVESYFMHSLKQATFVRTGSTKAIMALPEAQQTQIWTSVTHSDYEGYREATHNLHLDGGGDASTLRHLPLRLHVNNATAIQMPIAPQENGAISYSIGREKTLLEVLTYLLPDMFTETTSETSMNVVVHGIPVLLDVSIFELYRHFSYADGFLYVTNSLQSLSSVEMDTPLDVLPDHVAPHLAETRAHLLHKEPDRARVSFLRLPALESQCQAYLEATLRDFYAAGLYDIPVLLTFLEGLPNWHWTLDGCALLYNVSSALRAPASDAGNSSHALRSLEARQRKFPQLPLAFFLLKLISHLEGSARVRAESYWYAWVSPMLRAVASGQPLELTVLSRTGRHEYGPGDARKEELLYAPGDRRTFDHDRRNALCWIGDGVDEEGAPWPAGKDRTKAQWRFIPSDVHSDTFLIQNVRCEEYLYAADYAKFKKDKRGTPRSRVFTWRKPNESPGAAGHWQLVALQHDERDVFVLYNAYQREFLYAPSAEVLDSKRRYVLTRAAPEGARSISSSEGGAFWCAWRIAPAHESSMERGVEAFFAKHYPVAVDHLTSALTDLPDNTQHVKCFAYRMTANLRLRRFDRVAGDFHAIQALGGDKAAIFHGLAHLWDENAAFLASMASDVQIQAMEVATSRVNPYFMHHQVAKGDDLFVHGDFRAAIGCYQEAATCTPTIASSSLDEKQGEDAETTRQRVRAYVSCAKCFFALDEIENAWQYLSIAQDITGVSLEGEATILLWQGKCRRAQKVYDEALHLLEQAFDRASTASACVQSSALGASVNASVNAGALKRSILMEMKLVGLLSQQIYNALLSTGERGQSRENGQEDKILTQMMEIFHCPLSLELMDDPVTTPDGNTYERSMIEQHLDVNGCFDPLTRTPLTKSQLHRNRALKQLMETLLCNHRLGQLLASCST
ncbi:hypothetical protein PsorP6_015464 [Peronosclerospora sorghi]|uniref:Uncharacterized protein n=1 Tax=Peronosclerospora sorghi TaxID=230839 RepID=A0ACC0WQ15_9STRA|nr:hypothetical protein PsorP6_015464 [Peronosclerospora sorghi]